MSGEVVLSYSITIVLRCLPIANMLAIEKLDDAHTARKLTRIPPSSTVTAIRASFIALEPKRRSSKLLSENCFLQVLLQCN